MTLSSAQVRSLLRDVDDVAADVIRLASELIGIRSDNPPGNELAVAEHLIGRMEALGLTGPRLVGDGGPRPNLVWEWPGAGGGPRLALGGHMDTKPAGDLRQWRHDPWSPVLEGGLLHGLGASDMKAAIAAMVHAAAIVSGRFPRTAAGDPPAGDLLLVFTADEERAMNGARDLIAGGVLAGVDAIVIGEPAGIRHEWERLHVGSRGLSAIKVSATGTQMHSSLSDVLPSVNASAELARVLTRMVDDFAVDVPEHPFCEQGITVNVGVTLDGGVAYGVYPGRAEFGVDIRVPPGVDRAVVTDALTGFFERAGGDGSRVAWRYEAPPLDWIQATETPADHPVVELAKRAHAAVHGVVPPLGIFPGGTEATVYQAGGGIPCLPALGPGMLPVSHAPNEHVRVDAVVEAVKLYAVLIADFVNEPWPAVPAGQGGGSR